MGLIYIYLLLLDFYILDVNPNPQIQTLELKKNNNGFFLLK